MKSPSQDIEYNVAGPGWEDLIVTVRFVFLSYVGIVCVTDSFKEDLVNKKFIPYPRTTVKTSKFIDEIRESLTKL